MIHLPMCVILLQPSVKITGRGAFSHIHLGTYISLCKPSGPGTSQPFSEMLRSARGKGRLSVQPAREDDSSAAGTGSSVQKAAALLHVEVLSNSAEIFLGYPADLGEFVH